MNQTAGAARTPPRPEHSQGTPHSQTVSSLGSEQYRRESVDPILQFEWDRYTATGAACEAMLKGLFPSTPPLPSETTAKKLLRNLEQALSMCPEPAQYAPIATLCNDILTGHYASNRPTIDRPARWFVPLEHVILESDSAQRKPDIVVVVRSEWEEHVRSQLEENPIAQRRQSKEWKKVFPNWSEVSPHVRQILNTPDLLKAADLDPQLLRALAIQPPWECIVAIMEFNVSNSPDPTTSISPSVSSHSTNAAEVKPKTGPKSEESSSSATPGRVLRSPQSPSAEHDTPRPASKGASSSQNGGAKKSLPTPPASKKTLTPEVQLLSYFCEVMSASRYRDWTSGAIVNGTDFSLVTCDREGAIKSAPTSLRTADGVDTFAQWVLAVGSGTLAETGFSTIFGQPDGQIEGVCFSVPDNAQHASESSIQLQFGSSTTSNMALSDGVPPSIASTSQWATRRFQEFAKYRGQQPLARASNVNLYEANSVHYRDSSVNNMMYHRHEDQVVGILSDFDLAVSMTRSAKPSSAHRTGTAPFMALELLQPDAREQELSHDFEAALYILFWIALGYKGWKPPAGDPLSGWRRGTWAQIYTSKRAFIIDSVIIEGLIRLITPEHEKLRRRIALLHLKFCRRIHSEAQKRLSESLGIIGPAIGPMTAQEFFDILGPPPPGREPYSQIKTLETGSKA